MVTMPGMVHNDSLIIDRLGGNSVLAKMFGISSQAVSKWRKHGIPKPSRMYLELASPEAFSSECTAERRTDREVPHVALERRQHAVSQEAV